MKDYFGNSPIHVVLDMKVFNKSQSPCVNPKNNEGLDEMDVLPILSAFKDQIVGMDITEFNPCIGSVQEVKQTANIIRKCLVATFSLKEKSINILNEHTNFLIYRPTKQESPADYGWYILTAIPNDHKERLMKSIGDDNIITIEIDNKEYMVTKTNMDEQNQKSFYTTVNVLDTVLFPNEKISMVFELVNSNNLT